MSGPRLEVSGLLTPGTQLYHRGEGSPSCHAFMSGAHEGSALPLGQREPGT